MGRIQNHPAFSLRATAVLMDQGRVLVHESDPGSEAEGWALPGGGPLFGEHTAASVRRELREELGLDVEVTRLLWVLEHFVAADERLHAIDFIYLVDASAGWPQRAASRFSGIEEGPGPQPFFTWLAVDALANLPLWPSRLRSMLAGRLPDTPQHIVFYEDS